MPVFGLLLLVSSCGKSDAPNHEMEPAPDGNNSDDNDAEDAAAADLAGPFFDDDSVSGFEVTLDPAHWKALDTAATIEGRETYYPAQIRYQGQTYTGEIRYKGSEFRLGRCLSGEYTCQRISMKLKFDKANLFYGLRELNFHSMEEEDTGMREYMAYRLFRLAGVPAPRVTYNTLTVNSNQRGLFVVVEDISKTFLRQHFPNDFEGNLYKEVWAEHEQAAPYQLALKTNETATGPHHLLDLTLALKSGANFRQTVDAWVDTDKLARYVAADRVADNWDGAITSWRCDAQNCSNHNYFWYQRAAKPSLVLLPWDLDKSYHSVTNPYREAGLPEWHEGECQKTNNSQDTYSVRASPGCDPLLGGLAKDPAFMQAYWAHAKALLAGEATSEKLAAIVAKLQKRMEPFVQADQGRGYQPTHNNWTNAIAKQSKTIDDALARMKSWAAAH